MLQVYKLWILFILQRYKKLQGFYLDDQINSLSDEKVLANKVAESQTKVEYVFCCSSVEAILWTSLKGTHGIPRAIFCSWIEERGMSTASAAK